MGWDGEVRVLLIDDHPLFRSGIRSVLDGWHEKVEVVESSDCEEALALIASGAEFALILLDLNLPAMDGMTGLAKLRDAVPASSVVVLSAAEDARTIRNAIGAGAKGYIPKSADAEIIIGALRLVMSGGVYLPAGAIAAAQAPVAGELTNRQRDVLLWLVRGKSNKEIGALLGMAENTVRVHVAAILRNLDVRNRTEAGFAAVSRGLISTQDV